jgi:thiosulfate/3-mercaptopyruvate sulfurtransferase
VLCDDSRTALTSRLYFMLELYGFNMAQVKILAGGTLEWSAFNELDKEPVVPPRGSVNLKPANPELLVEWTDVYDDVVSRRDPNVVLLDASPKDMYTGEVIRHSIQGGHIPRAVNVVSLDGTDDQSQKWLTDDALDHLYQDQAKIRDTWMIC